MQPGHWYERNRDLQEAMEAGDTAQVSAIWKAKLKEWLKGVADWNETEAEAVRHYVRHLRHTAATSAPRPATDEA